MTPNISIEHNDSLDAWVLKMTKRFEITNNIRKLRFFADEMLGKKNSIHYPLTAPNVTPLVICSLKKA